jgi:hypothetical protein
MPDDPRLRFYGQSIAEARRHQLTKRSDDDGGEIDDGADLDEVVEPADGEQLSLFSVLSATVGSPDHEQDIFDDDDGRDDDGRNDDGRDDLDPTDDDGLVIDLRELPPPGPGPFLMVSRRDRERLREQNAEIVKDLVALTGRTHSAVNADLNRRSGVERVSTATAIQLRKRAAAGQGLLDRERKRRRMSRFV